jgi:hypothetical protein
VTGQRSADSQISPQQEFLKQGLALRRSGREDTSHRVKFVQSTRTAASINFSRYLIIY